MSDVAAAMQAAWPRVMSVSDNLVEAVARALATNHKLNPDDLATRWDCDLQQVKDMDWPLWHDYRDDARAAIEATMPDPLLTAAKDIDAALTHLLDRPDTECAAPELRRAWQALRDAIAVVDQQSAAEPARDRAHDPLVDGDDGTEVAL